MNVLYGLYSADEGEILIDGEAADPRFAGRVDRRGIGMVHQHFMLVPVFTVAENVILGNEPTNRFGMIDQREAPSKTVREISTHATASTSTPTPSSRISRSAIQQRVEIIKVLARDARLPRARRTDSRPHAAGGRRVSSRSSTSSRRPARAIVFITPQAERGARDRRPDRRSCARAGPSPRSLPGETTEDELADADGRPPGRSRRPEGRRPIPETSCSHVDELGRARRPRPDGPSTGSTFEVRAGEIVGIAGVAGQRPDRTRRGDHRPAPAARRVTSELKGKDITTDSPRADAPSGRRPRPRGPPAQRPGARLHRHREHRARRATTTSRISHGHRDGLGGRRRRRPSELVEQYDIRTPGVDVELSTLSGGNQQKVIVAREFGRDVDLIVASQPTRGIDVGSIEYIHSRIVEERDGGAAVLIVSSELDEVMALSDRLLVMFDGQIVAELDPRRPPTPRSACTCSAPVSQQSDDARGDRRDPNRRARRRRRMSARPTTGDARRRGEPVTSAAPC